MAYDYEKVKQAYEGLDAQQKQKFADMMKGSGNYADFMSRYNAEKTPTTTVSTTTANSSTPTQTSTSRNIAKPEYQGTGSIGTKTSPYENQGEGNYYYSNQTNRYEKYPTATQTSTQTTKVETPAENDTVKQLRDAWNNKSYEEQQKLLKSNPAMQNTLTKYGITNKQPEATPAQTPTQTPTAQKDKEWDYQDNSQARMDEIIGHLNDYRISDPFLFDDYNTFYNAFIAGKGRSEDQIKTLNDYYNKMKQYNKYDNLSSDEVGGMIARGEIPDDYLNYLKNSDPQRWAEIQGVRKDVEDQIMNESYLNTIASDAGFDMGENDFMKWQKGTFGLEDKNSDGLWDIIYHAPTQEELDLNNEDNEYEAEKLRIKNAYKDLQSDLTDQYPDADLSTIMVLAGDRGNKMMKALDSISVAQTKTQGRLKYLQNERAEMDKAGQAQINELQQNLGMYYDYSTQGMAEKAQAQYAATNITLDQADSGNETQKQMALDAAITPIFEQYGDIIQRSPAQVINDTIAYAKKNGIGLRQALEENFMKPLREKPAYQSMQSQMNATGLKREKVGKDANGNDIYGFVDLANKTVSPYGTIGGGVSSATANTYTVEEVSSNRDKRVSAMRDIANQYDNLGDMAEGIAYNMEGVGGGNLECGQYVNDYINAVTGNKGQYGNLISQKTALASNKNWDDIQVGDAIVFDYNINTPQWVLNSPQKEDLLKYGHVGFVTGINPDGSINMSHTNGGVVQNTVVKPGSSFYNSFAGSQHINKSQSLGKGFNEQLTNEYLAFIEAAGKPADQKKIAEGLGLSVEEMREQSNKYSWQQTADTYFDMLGRINNILSLAESGDLPSFMTRKNAQSEGFFGGRSTLSPDVSDWKADNDKIVDTLSLDSLINLKGRGATFGALSDSEREAIGRYATALGSPMSDAKYINELKQLRAKLIESSHGYLGDLTSYWQNQSYTGNQSYDWTAGI